MEDNFIRTLPAEKLGRGLVGAGERAGGERGGDKSNVFDVLASMGNDKKNGEGGGDTCADPYIL